MKRVSTDEKIAVEPHARLEWRTECGERPFAGVSELRLALEPPLLRAIAGLPGLAGSNGA